MSPHLAHAAFVEKVADEGIASNTPKPYVLKLDQLQVEAKGEPIALADQRSVQRMTQTYQGVPIYGDSVAFERNATGQVVHASGRYLLGIEQDLPRVEPTLNPDQAIQALREQWHIKKGVTSETPTRTKTRLFIYQPRHETKARLIYHVSYAIDNDADVPSNPTGLIDALTGEALEWWEGVASLQTVPAEGPGGNILIGKYRYGKERPTLLAMQRGPSCSFDQEGIKVSITKDYSIKENPWLFPCPKSVPEPINDGYGSINDLYYHTVVTKDMYEDILGFSPIEGGVHVLYSTIKADFAGYAYVDKIAWFASGADAFYPLVSLDVVAHEIGHGFTMQHSDLDTSGQAGAIFEAFGDMSGEAAEYYRDGQSDFIVMSANTKPDGPYGYLGGLRQMCHQSTDGKSIEHASQYNDTLESHHSNGVYNKAYCLLSRTPGWDQRKAFHVFALATAIYWNRFETFDTAACGAELAAQALGLPVADLQAAFDEVGVRCASDGDGS